MLCVVPHPTAEGIIPNFPLSAAEMHRGASELCVIVSVIVSGCAFDSFTHWERSGMKEQPLAYLLPALTLTLSRRERGAVQRQHRDIVTRTPLDPGKHTDL